MSSSDEIRHNGRIVVYDDFPSHENHHIPAYLPKNTDIVSLEDYIKIVTGYIRDALFQNYGSFFETETIYDIFDDKVIVLLSRMSITQRFEVSLRAPLAIIERDIERITPSIVNEWNAKLKKTCIDLGKSMTQNQLINPYFTGGRVKSLGARVYEIAHPELKLIEKEDE